ncbi:MAG: hypothetical protein PVJ27_11715 [Candidatus Brocadiaceae bacterium]|jgi:hypothetical protein
MRTSAGRAIPFSGACLVLLAVAVPLACGCHPPKAIPTYEYVTDYERMSDAHEPLVSLVYEPESTHLSRYRGVIVGDFAVGQEWIESRQKAFGYAALFRVLLQRELTAQEGFEFATLDKERPPQAQDSGGIIRLEGMVTRFDQGSGLMRYLSFFLFFLQSGATDFQVEGRLTDDATGRLLLEFVDRRRGIYNTPFGPNPRTLREGFAMNYTVRDAAASLAAFIGETCEGPTATETESAEPEHGELSPMQEPS